MDKIYTVAQVNGYVKRLFASDYALNNIYIKGEVSNCKYHSSGHIYFTLKDTNSAISCVMFASSRMTGLTFQLADGQSVVAGGNVSVYERDGKYQLYAKEIFLHGAGALYEEYERLKRKLYEEGLFDKEKKKPIEKFPKRVGIVTASTGAAIRDIESIAKRRNPYVQLVLYPAKVQGVGASQSIVKGIERLDQMNMDTIIVGRGGGSIEDLWAFNEEIVARAIFRAKTPIISGTGHETDTTIADYVADLRAPTPSAACELAIPDLINLLGQFNGYEEALLRPMKRKVEHYRHRLELMQWKLEQRSPSHRLQEQKMRLADLELRLNESLKRKIEKKKNQLALYTERLNGLSPTAKLARGYGYVTDQNGKTVTTVSDVAIGGQIEVTLLDGTIQAVVENTARKE